MNVIDVARDAQDVFEIMKDGGITLIPVDTGYGLASITPAASDRVFKTKGRGSHKRQSIIANLEMQRELLQLDSRAQDIVDTIVLGFDLPIGVLGTYNPDHPWLPGSTKARCARARPRASWRCSSIPARCIVNCAS
jgi:hypothetical protein